MAVSYTASIMGWLIYLLLLGVACCKDVPCFNRRNYGHDSFVCVCNKEECDTVSPVTVADGKYVVVTSSRDDKRFHKQELPILPLPDTPDLVVDTSTQYHSLFGFGGAFTDAAGINYYSLSEVTRGYLTQSYYSTDGIEYSMGRVPIGGSDFSTYAYSYNDVPGDVNLTKFALTEEDHKYKIPLIDIAKSLNDKLWLFASPWSAPAWVKSNNEIHHGGVLKEEYYSYWAEYFIKFLDEYKKNDIDFWGLTIQNEPSAGYIPTYKWNSMGWMPSGEGEWVKDFFGPRLQESPYADIKLMICDDQRHLVGLWADAVLGNEELAKWVHGIGIHWYWDWMTSAHKLTEIHNAYPNHFLFYTEACEGSMVSDKVQLGSWERGENYAANIIDDINNYVTGWMDWNLVLDEGGNPNWAKNPTDAPIIANATGDEFYKQPMFYTLGHFSKFLPRDSVRVDLTSETDVNDVMSTSFITPDNTKVLILLNMRDDDNVTITIKEGGNGITTNMPPKSIQTILW